MSLEILTYENKYIFAIMTSNEDLICSRMR